MLKQATFIILGIFAIATFGVSKAQAKCGFNSVNDYICQGGDPPSAAAGGGPPGIVMPESAARPQSTFTGPADPQAGMDFEAYMRDLRAQMAAAEEELAYQLANPLQHGFIGGDTETYSCKSQFGYKYDGSVVSLSGDHGYNKSFFGPKTYDDGTILDGRGGVWHSLSGKDSSGKDIKVNPTPILWGSFTGGPSACLRGGTILGEIPCNQSWCDSKSTQEAGVNVFAAGSTVDGVRVDNFEMGINISGRGDADEWTIKDVYTSGIRGDCVQNDGFEGGVIESSLFECQQDFYSSTNSKAGASRNSPGEQVTIRNNIIGMISMPGPFNASRNRCEARSVNGYGALIKQWGGYAPPIALENNIIYLDDFDFHQTGSTLAPETLNACSGNTLVWGGPGALFAQAQQEVNKMNAKFGPDCIKVTNDISVYTAAKQGWLAEHPDQAAEPPRCNAGPGG